MNSNVYFTLETLGKLYTDAAKAGGMEVLGCYKWSEALTGPNLKNKVSDFRVKQAKKKIIDLEPLIESGIDCEFGDDGEAWTSINTLDCTTNGKYPYENQLDQYGYCRPRMNYKMFNNGGECPLPEGFEVKLYWRDNSEYYIDSDYIDLRWDDTGRSGDIIAYEILGLADGYAYPWEQAE